MKVIGIDKESLSNQEIYCDISGTEEYTPFAKLPYGPAPRAQARGLDPWFGHVVWIRGLGPDLGG